MTGFLQTAQFQPSFKTRFPALKIILLLFVFNIALTAHAKDNDKDKAATEPLKLTNRDNQLVGKIWDVKNKAFINRQQLLHKALDANFVLLGETHDNIEHHRDHGWFINQISQKKPDVAIAMEMVNKKQADEINKNKNGNIDDVINILEQAKVGWEYDKYYRPVFSSILKNDLPLYPADLERSTMMKVVRDGKDSTPNELKQLLNKTPLPKTQQEALKKEIEATHCGMIDAAMTKAMMRGQRTRDAAMGNNLYKVSHAGGDKSKTRPVIMVSGSGHIRKDRGAPMYLKARDPDAKIVAIAWLEVHDDATDPEEYIKQWHSDTAPFDYVVFSPSANRPDPCEEMKKFMKHHNKKKHGKKDQK
jgi:uncharacterized iron-regulated protein